jgi:hypothetical protein
MKKKEKGSHARISLLFKAHLRQLRKMGLGGFPKLSLPFLERRLGPDSFGGCSSRVAVPSLQFRRPFRF